MTLQQKLEQALEPLVSCQTADAVADVLRKAGVKGHRVQCRRCPVSRYVSRMSGCKNVIVYRDRVIRRAVIIPTTQPIYDFISAFDAGDKYTDLIAEGAAK